MKATVRVLISVLVLVVAGAVTAPAAAAQSPATQHPTTAVVAAPAVAGAVVSVTPARIADSRAGLQIPGAVGAVGTVPVQVTGTGGIPGGGVAAVLATVTVVWPQQAGYVTVWPSGTNRPGTSNLNFQAGQTIANTVLIRVGSAGGIELFNGSYGSVQLIVDVTGYTRSGTPTDAGAVAALTPSRIVDSRIGQQLPGPVPALATTDMQIGGQGGIPPAGVAGVVATVTVVDPAQAGYLTVWPSNSDQPGTSNLNFQAGQTIATTVIAPVSGDLALRLFNGSYGSLQVIVDVSGYTLSGTPKAAGTVVSGTARILDSRSGPQLYDVVSALQVVGVQVAWPGSEVAAAVLTLTVVSPQASGYLTLWPAGTDRPGTSSLNFQAEQNIATTVVVPVGPDGKIYLFNGSPGATHLVVDINGYTLPTLAATTGTVWAFGRGTEAEVGNGFWMDMWVPVRVSGLSHITAIAAGEYTGYALRGDGTVWAWGNDLLGQLGDPSWSPGTPAPVQVSGLTGVTAIAAGPVNGYALRADGTVWAWGQGRFGELGNGGTIDSQVPVQVSGLTGVTAIAGGANGHALRSDGTVWAWGYGERGGLGSGGTADSLVPVQVSGLTGVTAIAAGSGTGYALRGDGTVWAWGEGRSGELGNGSDGPANYSLVPIVVPGLTSVASIAAGSTTGYAFLSDDTLRGWGNGVSTTPVQITDPSDVHAITASSGTGYAVRGDGTAWAWGNGQLGQLGNGTSTPSNPVPTAIPGLTDITAVASGWQTGYALTR